MKLNDGNDSTLASSIGFVRLDSHGRGLRHTALNPLGTSVSETHEW
jgi:hypothetical protein